ncbi:MAG: hypothetical protein WBE08_06130 [Methyloceanibacter sp.]
MTDEYITIRAGQFAHDPGPADFEQSLRMLIAIARGEGRSFLAHLLLMALMQLREESEGRSEISH